MPASVRREEMKRMLKVISSVTSNVGKATILERTFVRKTANKAIETIKNELPEEAQTLEVMEYIISEMQDVVKESRIFL